MVGLWAVVVVYRPLLLGVTIMQVPAAWLVVAVAQRQQLTLWRALVGKA